MGTACSSNKPAKLPSNNPLQIVEKHNSDSPVASSIKKESTDSPTKQVTQIDIILNEDPLLVEPGHRKTSQWLEHQDSHSSFIFGFSTKNVPIIYKFDPKTLAVTEQKVPKDLEIAKQCNVTYVSETRLILTGGIKSNSDSSTDSMYFYNPTDGTAEKAPPFNESRCDHMTLVTGNHLYLLGGKSMKAKQEIFLKSVERYDILEKSWEILEDLPVARAGGFCLLYNNNIYVVGGYVNTQKIVRTAHVYDIENNSWNEADVNLPQALAFSIVLSPASDLIQVFGGIGNHGDTCSNYLMDLKEDTYIKKKSFPSHLSTKSGLASKERLYLVGDSLSKTQVYDIKNDSWEERPQLFKSISEQLKIYWTSHPTLFVETEANRKEKKENTSILNEKRCFLFGDDITNFILECNFTKRKIREHPLPSTLKLYSYQKVLRLADGKYFICGGINKARTHVSKNSYLYDPLIRKAKKVGKMVKGRFNFSLGCIGMSIYVIGGQSLDPLGNIVALNTCEKFNFEKKKWEAAPSISQPRYNAVVYNQKQKIYLIGGCMDDKTKISTIEVYTDETNRWELMKVQLKIPLESTAISLGNNKGQIHLIGGKEENEIADKIWDFDTEQGDMWEFGSLKEPKFGHKIYEYDKAKVCIFGGDKHIVELFDMREGKHIEDNFSNEIDKTIRQIISRYPNVSDFSLKGFSLDQ